ncbi:MAG: hypothetical protein HC927_01825 [Deltaproteobacteria bacterium]|nr:hypothetical protein [Deltaproteobacteria bacterium]
MIRWAMRLGWGTRYTYSAEGDLLGEFDSARGTTRYVVDAAHRLIEVTTPSGERLIYEHDAADNLISKPGLSRLEFASGNRAWASALEMFEHDARDRLAYRRHRGGGTTYYHYDSFDMLVRIVGPDLLWQAGYDAIGRRLWIRQGGFRHEFWWDGDRLAAEQTPDGKLRIYLYGGLEALSPIGFIDYLSSDAEPESGHLYHVFNNGTGMPLHIEDEYGTIVWWARHIDAYGAIDAHPTSVIEYNLRWPGHYFDTDTGLHYNRYRYYDPALGRYIQSDPIGYRGSETNLYAYCTNPLVHVDVLGLMHTTDVDHTDKGDDAHNSVSGVIKPPVVIKVEMVDPNALLQDPRIIDLGTDPKTGFREAEALGGARIEAALGRQITRSSDEAADFVDDEMGPISLKGPLPPAGNPEGLARAAIKDAQINTGTRALFIDLSGLSSDSASKIRDLVTSGTKNSSKLIFFLE